MKHHFRALLLVISVGFLSMTNPLWAQLQTGFNAHECDDILLLSDAFNNRVPVDSFAKKHNRLDFQLILRSPAMGLDNMYDLWLKDQTIYLSLRGTTGDQKSLMSDFYCAMMPANGTVQLTNEKSFTYKLADDARAAVHAGFLAGFSYLADHFQYRLDSLYNQGYRSLIIGGHSMGGAHAFMFSSWIHYLQQDGKFGDLQIKVYAIASPKVGNMYYAYDYDNIMQSLWSFSVTNSLDAIPEMPMTTQQLVEDMNADNPVLAAKDGLKSEPLLKRMVLKMAYNTMERKASKSAKSYQKYLGKYVGKYVHDMVPGLKMPIAVNSSYYVRPAVPISLVPKQNYLDYFKEEKSSFYHHELPAYRFLLRQKFNDLPAL